MTTHTASTPSTESATFASWMPMIIIALAQIQLAFNVSALQVSIGSIVDDFNTSPTNVSTALVVYSLAVAGFVMLGAKLGKRFGSRLAFQIGIAIQGIAMGLMAFSSNASAMVAAQGLAGLAVAVVVPALVVLIATNYEGKQQAQCLGLLGAAQAAAGVLAFLIAGFLGTLLSWRYAFGLLVFVAIAVIFLSFRLKTVAREPELKIDWNGAIIAAAAITFLSLGFNYLNAWGLLLASSNAPFNILGLSPAPIMIIFGIMLGQLFFVWSGMRQTQNGQPLLRMEVLDTAEERAGIYALLIIGALGPAVNFLIPLYVQIVQGRSSLQTAVVVIPYSLAIFAGTALIVRLFDRLSPRQIGRYGFAIVAIGLTWLAFTINHDWGTPMVIIGLVILGLGEGSLLTLVFNVLVSASPKELAGDVGALRGTVNNLSTALGTAIIGALAVGMLAALISSSATNSPAIPPALLRQVNLDNVNFISNDQLLETLEQTTATPEQVTEAVRINEDTRLRSLKASFLVLAGFALLAISPAGALPGTVRSDVPSGPPEKLAKRSEPEIASAA